MKLWRHFVLVGLTGAVPLFIASLMLINATYLKPIHFSQQERRGLTFQRLLEPLLVLLPRYQEAARRTAAGEPSEAFVLADLQQQIDQAVYRLSTNYQGHLGAQLKFTDAELALRGRDNARLAVLQTNWTALRQSPSSAIARGPGVTHTMDAVRSMFAQSGDASNLILDNELESYYLMDITVVALPQEHQRLNDVLFIASQYVRAGRVAGTNQTEFAVLSSMLRLSNVNRILKDTRIVLSESQRKHHAALTKDLPPAVDKLNATTAGFLQELDRLAAGQAVSSTDLEAAGWNAQNESHNLWRVGADGLDYLLALRVRNLESSRSNAAWLLVGTALLAAFVMGLLIRSLLRVYGAAMSRTADELRDKEARLRGIGDHVPNGAVYEILRDSDGTMKFLYLSAGIEQLTGLTADALMQDASLYFKQILPEDEPIMLAARRESLANKSVFNVVVRVRRTDGSVRWMQLASMPRRLPDGRFVWDGIAQDVTERKQAEEVLKESEQRFRSLIDQAPTAIGVSRNGTRLYVNRKYLEMFGLQSVEEALSHPVGSDLTPESRALVESYFKNRIQGLPAPTSYEVVGRRKDGTTFPMHVVVALVDLPDGPASIGFITDISGRRRAENQIQYLNRVYAVLSGINGTIVHEKDPQAMLHAACRIAVEKGKFRMAWIGLLESGTQRVKPVAAAGMVDGHPDLLQIDLAGGAYADGPPPQAVSSGEHAICNDIERDPIHAPWWGEAMRRGYRSSGSFPLKVEGRVVGLLNLYANEPDFFSAQELDLLDELALDIGFALEFHDQEAKRQQAEIAVRHSEERFARMFKNNPLPTSLSRLSDGKFVDANESFLRMSGFARDEVIGHSALELGAYPDPAVRPRLIQRLHEDGHVHQHEQTFRTKSGNLRDHLLWMELMTVDGEPCILTLAVDITEQKEAERQQKLLEDQLRQTQKLESLGTLAGGIAHDFNNILGAIISFTELAKMDNAGHADTEENLGEVLKASHRATGLVQQILAFSRQQKHEVINLQLAPVIKEALKLLRATIPATIEIRQNISGELPDVRANATQIHQVIMNLCTNASHAIKKTHGTLTVQLDHVRLRPGQPRPHVELKPGDYLRLQVADTGHGMDPATVKRIFEPFFTTKGPGEGTGLGLAVVHGIIKEHHGVILVDSTPGQGTTFTIYLPAVAPAAAPSQSDTTDILPGNGQCILFVDDEPALGDAAQKMLRRLGYQPVVFQSSEAAWQAIQQAPQNFDAVVSDLTMPVMTGLDLADRVLSVSPQLPIILVTGSAGELTQTAVQEKGIRQLLNKPIDYQSLGSALSKVLRSPSVMK